jgi:long-chain acyl-CoA synthetase
MNTDKTLSRQHWIDHITGPGQDYELVPGTVCGRPCRVFKNGPQTLRELFADNRSEKTFLVYQQQRYSFEQVYQRTAQLANVLVSQYGI